MTSATSNPKVEHIRHSVETSYNELNQLIANHLARVESTKLYQVPAQDEWTIMENLAHVAEFMPYWAGEIEKLVAAPGQPFGRTLQHEGRLRAIKEHGTDSLEQAHAALPACYARLDQVLRKLNDSDLELTGIHPKYGEKPLAWFIDDFVVDHLAAHVEQLRTSLATVSEK